MASLTTGAFGAVTVPGAPTIGAATAGNASASIAFTAPSSNGGAVIKAYAVSCVTGGTTKAGKGTGSPITVESLTNNKKYSCTVKAINAKGSSVDSGVVLVTPTITVPGAPTLGAATVTGTQASIAFTAPASNGGSAITAYTASCVTGTGATATTVSSNSAIQTLASPVVVSGLAAGSSYTCTVKAVNRVGSSAASGTVSAVVSATAPGAPTLTSVTAGSAKATVVFTAPASNGGSSITGYDASCVNGTTTKLGSTTSATATSLAVSSLTNGVVYTCSVKAKNTIGSSLSSASALVVPGAIAAKKPGVPTVNSVTPGVGQITVAFTKAATSAIAGDATGFIATCTATGTTPVVATGASTATSIVVTGLTAGASYSCTVGAYNTGGMNTTKLSNSFSTTPTAASTTVTYSTPANFETAIAKTVTPAPTLTAASTVTNRGYYMISDAATASKYATIGSTYNATTGYTVGSGTLSTFTYKDYLTKTMQLVKAGDGFYRIDSYLHPNNSIDWGGSVASPTLKFVNNFGKTSATGNGFVTFAVTLDTSGKAVTLKAQSHYTYSTTATPGTGSTSYAGTFTKDADLTGLNLYVKLTGTAYSLNATATSFYLYKSPLNLGIPTFMDPTPVAFVSQAAAPFLIKVTSTGAVEAQIAGGVNDTYKNQVSAAGANATPKVNADARLALIKTAVEGNKGSLRYAPALYIKFRDALLANKLVSDSISDGTPGQNLVPYVYFTNEMDDSGVYHPFMVVVNYGNPASPNGLKDIPSPPCLGQCGTAVTRFSNLENYITMIPMRDYGKVDKLVTENTTMTTNLWSDVSGKVGSTVLEKNVYTYADVADNGLLIDGSVMFPLFTNTLVPAHLGSGLSASGCHVGQGGGGPHCHADGYQSGQGLGLYNDSDYSDSSHPPVIGFGYDGIALFGQYRIPADSAMLGYGTLDEFGGHNHDAIGYHYHAHTVADYQPVGLATTYKSTLHVLIKGAYIGKVDTIPNFRSRTVNSLNNNKYMGGTVK